MTRHQRGTGLPRDSHLGFLEDELHSLADEPEPSEASVEEAKAAPDLLAAAVRLADAGLEMLAAFDSSVGVSRIEDLSCPLCEAPAGNLCEESCVVTKADRLDQAIINFHRARRGGKP